MEIIGHRGASGLAPENTLAAFRLAAELGAGYIETDLQLSADGRIVLIHDGKLQRTTTGRGMVAGKTLEELRRLDAGAWFPKRTMDGRRSAPRFAGERIPTLEELFDVARQGGIGLYLEIKVPCSSGTEKAVIEALHQAQAAGRSTLICFDLEVLQRARKIDSEVKLGYLFDRRMPGAVARAAGARVRAILPRAGLVTGELIEEARREGLKIVTWTVNDSRRMKQLISLGVDGIMSDFPDRLAALVRGC